MGCVVNEPTTTCPNTVVTDHVNLICVRIDTDGEQQYGFRDFHFMKLGPDGYWYHKPGRTNPLRYNYTPTNDRVWINEVYDGSINEFVFSDFPTYDSEIYFIEYTSPHKWTGEAVGTNAHNLTCTVCDYEEISNCEYEYTYLYDDMHNARCKFCSNGYSGAFCTFDYSVNGDGTHTGVCACGNTKTEDCYLSYTNIGNEWHSTSCTICGYIGSTTACIYGYEYNNDGTHTKACVLCGNNTTASCTMDYVYTGTVDGTSTHKYACTECDYSAFGSTACTYKNSDYCSFCGIHKDSIIQTRVIAIPINEYKDTIFLLSTKK